MLILNYWHWGNYNEYRWKKQSKTIRDVLMNLQGIVIPHKVAGVPEVKYLHIGLI